MAENEMGMNSEEMNELISEFLAESEGHIQVLNQNLLKAEELIKQGGSLSDDEMNAMFRAAHTIKGTASFFGLTKTVKLTHEMETILQKVKNKEMVLTGDVIDVLFRAFDTLEKLFASLHTARTEDADITEPVAMIQAVLKGECPVGIEKKEAPPPPAPAAEVQKEAIIEKYLSQFIIEAKQNIETLDGKFMILEKDTTNTDVIFEVFRLMHTIKGSSGLINATSIAKVAHSMENVLSIIRETPGLLTPDMVSQMFEGLDAIKAMTDELAAKMTCSMNIAPLCGIFNAMQEKLNKQVKSMQAVPAPAPAGVPEKPVSAEFSDKTKALMADAAAHEKDMFCIEFEIDPQTPMRSLKALLVVERLQKSGTVIETTPAVDSLDSPGGSNVVRILFASIVNEREIRSLMSLDSVKLLSIERMEVDTEQGQAVAEDEKPVPVIEQKVEKRAESIQKQQKKEGGSPMVEQVQVPNKVSQEAKPGVAPSLELSTIRIDSRKLDKLMNLSGELVTLRAQFARLLALCERDMGEQRDIMNTIKEVKTMSEQIVRKDFIRTDGSEREKAEKVLAELYEQLNEVDGRVARGDMGARIHELDELTSFLGKISSDIQSGVMQTRMIPVEGVFTRFKRMVRDISKELGKDVELMLEGEDTELDKKIVDSLGDPLTHMVRNAIDHGLDDPQRRKELGKPEKGTVTLRASHRGNNICIEVSDDGRGIDVEKITAKAIEKGIITTDQAERMSEREKLNIIFLPGFSTAQKVTGLSGRGVGMDVVKNMVTAVNGVVDIETEINKGTKFTMMIPLTLAIIQALLVVIKGETYAFPLELVTEIIKVMPEEVYSVDGNDTVKLRGHALSLIELEKIIKLTGTEKRAEGAKKVVVVTDGTSQIGVVVDSLIGEDEIVIKSLTDHFAKVNGVSGASILGDGSVALILDPIAIIATAK